MRSLKVTNVEYLSEYKLKVKFNNGAEKIIDMKAFLEKNKDTVFSELLDVNNFKKVYVDFTVCWPNEIDLAPETLYELSV